METWDDSDESYDEDENQANMALMARLPMDSEDDQNVSLDNENENEVCFQLS